MKYKHPIHAASNALSRRSVLGAGGSLAVAGLAGLAGTSAFAQEVSWAGTLSAGVKEGKVVFYHNLNTSSVESLAKEFRNDIAGIDIEMVRLGSAPLVQRFSTEYAANRNIADVVLTTVDPSLLDGVKAGWAAAWTPPELKPYPAAANYNKLNMLFNVQTVRDAIVWNKQRVRPADAPKEWADLFHPKWKGKVGMNAPWRSVAQQAIIAYWDKLGLGDTAAKMKANEVRFFEGSGGVLQAVVRGDVQVAQMLDLPLEAALADGAPIGFTYPKSGTTLSQLYTFVSSKAPHPNAGKVLVNWLLSAKGQAALQKFGGMAGTRPGIPAMAHIPPTASLSKVQDGLELVTPAKQKEIVDLWRKTFGVQ